MTKIGRKQKKHLHDSLKSRKETNQDVPESSKFNVAKRTLKRKKRLATVIFRPPLLRVCLFILP